MKLKLHQATSLKEIADKSKYIQSEILNALNTVEAYTAVSRIENRPVSICCDDSVDKRMLREAVDSVDAVEFALKQMSEAFDRRRMSMSHKQDIVHSVDVLGSRLYRIMWEMALSEEDQVLLKDMLKNMTALQVWVGDPEAVTVEQYRRLKSPVSGTVAFAHCQGYTFLTYNKGRMKHAGWSVLLTVVEDAIKTAQHSITEGINILKGC